MVAVSCNAHQFFRLVCEAGRSGHAAEIMRAFRGIDQEILQIDETFEPHCQGIRRETVLRDQPACARGFDRARIGLSLIHI